MKIKQEHFNKIRSAMFAMIENGRFKKEVIKCNPLIEETVASYQKTYTRPGCNPVKVLMWDLFRAAQIEGNSIDWMCKTLYPIGLNDKHVETALKKIFIEMYPPAKDLLN